VSWTIVKNELQCTDLATLQTDAVASGNIEASVFTKSAGTCMAFSPANPSQFLIGTEDGAIRLCSTAYGSKYLNSFSVRPLFLFLLYLCIYLPLCPLLYFCR
jgi:hypothetical protein